MSTVLVNNLLGRISVVFKYKVLIDSVKCKLEVGGVLRSPKMFATASNSPVYPTSETI